jgi:hypothetical protein
MFDRCPKCDHRPLPAEQAFPAACPACGVILARVGERAPARLSALPAAAAAAADDEALRLRELLVHVPAQVDPIAWWLRGALLAALAAWGGWLVRADLADGEIMGSFIHLPLLVFHEAGHVVFRVFGETMMIAGGMLGQLTMPAILGVALLLKNRDPFGAAVALWLFGVSLLDIAPYMYDALDPRLVLLNGQTGEEGGHDFIGLFTHFHVLPRAQAIGRAAHALGTGVVLLALAWGAGLVWRQRGRIDAGG